jgi:hypothetical protein
MLAVKQSAAQVEARWLSIPGAEHASRQLKARIHNADSNNFVSTSAPGDAA